MALNVAIPLAMSMSIDEIYTIASVLNINCFESSNLVMLPPKLREQFVRKYRPPNGCMQESLQKRKEKKTEKIKGPVTMYSNRDLLNLGANIRRPLYGNITTPPRQKLIRDNYSHYHFIGSNESTDQLFRMLKCTDCEFSIPVPYLPQLSEDNVNTEEVIKSPKTEMTPETREEENVSADNDKQDEDKCEKNDNEDLKDEERNTEDDNEKMEDYYYDTEVDNGYVEEEDESGESEDWGSEVWENEDWNNEDWENEFWTDQDSTEDKSEEEKDVDEKVVDKTETKKEAKCIKVFTEHILYDVLQQLVNETFKDLEGVVKNNYI